MQLLVRPSQKNESFMKVCSGPEPGTRVAESRSMVNATEIKPHTPVVCSNDGQFAEVDHMEGTNCIKLKRDDQGEHHYIPLSWVKFVDDKVHVDRSGEQAMQEWSTEPQTGNA